jgi:uncharacterized tellurite resistance protein B-like protein
MTFESDFFRGIRRVIVQVMFSDGRVDADELETARDIHRQITGDELSAEVLRAEALSLRGSSEEDLLQYLAVLSRNLNKSGKEMIVRCAFWVASGDEDVDDAEEALVYRIGRALQMDRAQIRKVLEQSAEGGGPEVWH